MREEAGPTCRVCGRLIEVRHGSTGGYSTSLGHWTHLATEDGAKADKDHDALR
jgi:hypothetical protein